MRKSLIVVVISFIIAVLLVNTFVNEPIFENPKEKLEFVIKENQNDRLDLIYLELLTEDSLNIDYLKLYLLKYTASAILQNQL